METTIKKAHELEQTLVDTEFENMMTLKLSDAIRLGSSNSEQAFTWGNGETQCALHAAVQAAMATGFIDV